MVIAKSTAFFTDSNFEIVNEKFHCLTAQEDTEMNWMTAVLSTLQAEQEHSWYKSPSPPPAVVYFLQSGAAFTIENAKFWPVLAMSRIYAL